MDIDSVEPGDDFVEVITTTVGSCDVLLALIGSNWLTITNRDGQRRLDDPDDFVRLEIETALASNVRVIPILVEGAQMPRAAELPASLAKLAHLNALELSTKRFGTDTRKLIGTITKAQERARQEARSVAERRRQIEQLQTQLREQHAAQDWDAVVATSDKLAELDLDADDPDGLARTAREGVADRRRQIEQLQTQLREQHAAQDWDAVVATSDKLAELDPAAADPDGLASDVRQQIASRQKAQRETDRKRRIEQLPTQLRGQHALIATGIGIAVVGLIIAIILASGTPNGSAPHSATVPRTSSRSAPSVGSTQPLTIPSKVKVEVLNGSGVSRVTSQAAAELTRRGFNVTGTGDAENFAYTKSVIEYSSAADMAAANTLEQELTDVTLLEVPSLVPGTVALILGSDFTGLKPLTIPSKVKVEVLNGSGVSRVTSQAAAELTRRGFNVTGTGDAENFAYTKSVIEYSSAADMAAANTLEQELTDVTLLEVPSLVPGTVALILGSDFTGLKPLPAHPSPTTSPR